MLGFCSKQLIERPGLGLHEGRSINKYLLLLEGVPHEDNDELRE